MIDLHCHLLPFVDDGPDSVEHASRLVALALGRGITHAVLTPHVYPGVWNNTLETLKPLFESFERMLEASGLPLSVRLGGEVRLLPECLEMAARDELPIIGHWEGGRVVLIELPDGQIPVGTDKAMSFLRARGYVPMIAHPERNKDVMRDWRRVLPLKDLGCLFQITAASVVGAFGEAARRTSRQLLDADVVTVVATDTHNLAHRPPLLAEARVALLGLYGAKTAENLTRTIPGHILGISESGETAAGGLAGVVSP